MKTKLRESALRYVPAPTGGFEHSWSAVLGAMVDEGVRIKAEDRASGTVHGMYDNIGVRSIVRTQADGSVRVEFNTSGHKTVRSGR